MRNRAGKTTLQETCIRLTKAPSAVPTGDQRRRSRVSPALPQALGYFRITPSSANLALPEVTGTKGALCTLLGATSILIPGRSLIHQFTSVPLGLTPLLRNHALYKMLSAFVAECAIKRPEVAPLLTGITQEVRRRIQSAKVSAFAPIGGESL